MIDSKCFIDTSPYIYCLEGTSETAIAVRRFFNDNYDSGTEFVTSAVTFEEYLIQPFRNNDTDCINRFYKFIENMETDVIQIDEKVSEEAARIRAKYQHFKAMDALQLASAKMSVVTYFLQMTSNSSSIPILRYYLLRT